MLKLARASKIDPFDDIKIAARIHTHRVRRSEKSSVSLIIRLAVFAISPLSVAKMREQLGWTMPPGFRVQDLKWGLLPAGHQLGHRLRLDLTEQRREDARRHRAAHRRPHDRAELHTQVTLQTDRSGEQLGVGRRRQIERCENNRR